jgi:hypothetical protein
MCFKKQVEKINKGDFLTKFSQTSAEADVNTFISLLLFYYLIFYYLILIFNDYCDVIKSHKFI